MRRNLIYYEPQDGFGTKEYYALHRDLHRLFFYDKKYGEEIAAMDVSRLTEETKVLIYCIIRYYHKESLYDKYSNLQQISKMQPLKKRLVIDEAPFLNDPVYEEMNILY